MRTTLGELKKAVKEKDKYLLSNLPNSKFRAIFNSIGDLTKYKFLLPEEFHKFLNIYLLPTPFQRHRLRKISKDNAKRFFIKIDQLHPLTAEIKLKVLKCFYNLLKAFLPAGTNTLPPHTLYNYKVELIPGYKLLYSKTRPMSRLELKVIKRWLDDSLKKG